MPDKIVKRDGTVAVFNSEKIKIAIEKAFRDTNEVDDPSSHATVVTEFILLKVSENATVEEIQDLVEQTLMACGYPETAKSYILYRAEHTKVRTRKEELADKLFGSLSDIAQHGKASAVNKGSSGNANIDSDTAMGKMLHYGSETSKIQALEEMISPEFAEAHRNGDIHIHDLDFLPMKTLTCCQINLEELFKNGFSTGHGFLREPNSIGSYAALAAIAIQANQNDQHGGQSVPAFDFYMAPGVKKTFLKELRKNIKNSLEDRLDCNYDELVDEVIDGMVEEEGFVLSKPENKSSEKFVEKLQEKIEGDSENISNAVYFAYKRAVKETDKATYQAMEGFVHNLNTMHSRAGEKSPTYVETLM